MVPSVFQNRSISVRWADGEKISNKRDLQEIQSGIEAAKAGKGAVVKGWLHVLPLFFCFVICLSLSLSRALYLPFYFTF